jgi:hypothetical protein
MERDTRDLAIMAVLFICGLLIVAGGLHVIAENLPM